MALSSIAQDLAAILKPLNGTVHTAGTKTLVVDDGCGWTLTLTIDPEFDPCELAEVADAILEWIETP